MPLKNFLTKIKKVDPIAIFVEFAKQKGINNEIVLAIQKRLYAKGITGDGIELQTDSSGSGEVYSPVTIRLKDESNDPTNRVTLKDTGYFYDSMVTVVSKLYLEIKADFDKDDGHMQENFKQTYPNEEKFEQSVLSLNETEIVDILISQYLTFFQNKVNELLRT